MGRQMTSRERLISVLNRQLPDRIPIAPRLWAWFLERYGNESVYSYLKLTEVFDYDPIVIYNLNIPDFIYTQLNDHNTLENVEVTLDIDRKDDKQYIRRKIKTPAGDLNDVMIHPPAGKEYGISPNPEKLEPIIKSSKDLECIKFLLPDPARYDRSDIAELDRIIGEKGFYSVRPHMGVDHMLVDSFGIQNAMMLYYDDRQLFGDAIKVFHDHYKKCLVYALEKGSKMIFDSWYNCGLSAGWSPQIFREFFLPCIMENAEITHSYGAYYHFYDDGKIMGVLDDLKKTKMDLISTLCPPPAGDADPVKIKQILGGIMTLTGFVDLMTIRFGTVEEVVRETRNAIEILGKNGGYILGTSDSIRDKSPFENVKAFFETGLRYGSYL